MRCVGATRAHGVVLVVVVLVAVVGSVKEKGELGLAQRRVGVAQREKTVLICVGGCGRQVRVHWVYTTTGAMLWVFVRSVLTLLYDAAVPDADADGAHRGRPGVDTSSVPARVSGAGENLLHR